MNHAKPALVVVMLSFALLKGSAIAGQPTTVALAIDDNRANLLADIDGHKMRLLFDLGGDAPLALTQAALDALAIKATGPSHRATDFKGNTLEARTFRVARLQVGNVVFTNVPGNVELHASYIGPPLLAAYRIVLDYRRGRMTLIPPGDQHIERAGCSGEAVSIPEGISKVQTDFGDLTLVWDTGAAVSFVRKSRIEEAHAKVTNQAVLIEQFRLNGVDFGPLHFRLIEFSEPPGVDGFIGGNFFARHVVCLDFPGKRILIQR